MKAKLTKEEHKKNLGIIPVIDTIKGTLTYGLYPQTHVNDAATIAALNALTSAEDNGWYLYNGEYYAYKTARLSPSLSINTFNDGTIINSGASYWFKCEPIKWKILSSNNGTYSLVSLLLLDTHRYDEGSKNYAYSEIRSWLNNYFLDTAFNLNSSLIQITTIYNLVYTIISYSNSNACAVTYDSIYLLSYEDYLNVDYGFSAKETSTKTRKCKPTDYALANNYYGGYWTRSPSRWGSSHHAYHVWDNGYLFGCGDGVETTHFGVRPALTIKL